MRRARFECRLPKTLVVAASPSPRSLHIQVELESTSDSRRAVVKALVDSGAMSAGYIDLHYVRENDLSTRRLLHPIPVFNVDGTPNDAGAITEVVDTVLHF